MPSTWWFGSTLLWRWGRDSDADVLEQSGDAEATAIKLKETHKLKVSWRYSVLLRRPGCCHAWVGAWFSVAAVKIDLVSSDCYLRAPLAT